MKIIRLEKTKYISETHFKYKNSERLEHFCWDLIPHYHNVRWDSSEMRWLGSRDEHASTLAGGLRLPGRHGTRALLSRAGCYKHPGPFVPLSSLQTDLPLDPSFWQDAVLHMRLQPGALWDAVPHCLDFSATRIFNQISLFFLVKYPGPDILLLQHKID